MTAAEASRLTQLVRVDRANARNLRERDAIAAAAALERRRPQVVADLVTRAAVAVRAAAGYGRTKCSLDVPHNFGPAVASLLRADGFTAEVFTQTRPVGFTEHTADEPPVQ